MTHTAARPNAITPQPPRHGLDSLLIDTATLEHVPYLRRLKAAVMEDRYRPTSDEDDFQAWRELYCTDGYFERHIADPNTLLLCIGSLREPVGMVVIRKHGTRVEIDDLLVLHPRQGDGHRLITACLRYAEAWRATELYIDVYPGHESAAEFLNAHGLERSEDSSNDLGYTMHRYTRSLESTSL